MSKRLGNPNENSSVLTGVGITDRYHVGWTFVDHCMARRVVVITQSETHADNIWSLRRGIAEFDTTPS